MQTYSPARRRIALFALAALLFAVAVFSLTRGVIASPAWEVFALLPRALPAFFGVGTVADNPAAPTLVLILAEIRLPRLALGLLVGAGLAMCGAVMQGLFRNPMADPGLLGVSSGAAFGAVLCIVLGDTIVAYFGGDWSALRPWLLPGMAFAGGAIALTAVHRLSLAGGKTDIATMLLAGLAVNAICGALLGLLTYIAADAELRELVFWSLGGLEITSREKLFAGAALVLPVLILLPRFARKLNANLLGEREAGHLGVNMERVKRRLILLVAVAVGAAVSLSGVIGFVGLLVPHCIRLVLGPDHRLLLPASALFGAALLVTADIAAREAAAPAEIPVGIITAILGGPFFLYLLLRYRRARMVL